MNCNFTRKRSKQLGIDAIAIAAIVLNNKLNNGRTRKNNLIYKCSRCGKEVCTNHVLEFAYCPDCGKKMFKINMTN